MPQLNNDGVRMRWSVRWSRVLLSEIVSTSLLVCLGCMSQVPLGGPDSVSLTHPALSFGLLVLCNVCAFGSISGAHMNPAVSFAAALLGRLEPTAALAYALAQCIGAIIGFSVLVAVTPAELMKFPVGATVPTGGVSPLAAMFIEAVITGALVFTVCGLQEPDSTAPIKLGLVVSGLIFAAGPATGASLNPARSLAPALLHGVWQHHWVYWVGPLGGAALAALLHRYVLALPPAPASRDPAVDDLGADVPLQDKP